MNYKKSLLKNLNNCSANYFNNCDLNKRSTSKHKFLENKLYCYCLEMNKSELGRQHGQKCSNRMYVHHLLIGSEIVLNIFLLLI